MWAAAPAQPGDDWPALYARLESRDVGRVLGSGVSMLACGTVFTVVGWPTGELSVWMVILVCSAVATTGTLLGHLRGARASGSLPRLASLRRRELADYLTPGELRLVRLAAVVPLLAALFGFVVATRAGAQAVTGAVVVTLSLVSLLVGSLAESFHDTNHRWARQHAVGGVPS